MTLYARSDLAAVAVSPAHGGCGRSHSRPAPGGIPEKLWKLECSGGCEDHLRHSDQWSTTLSEIPETFDETKAREDFDKRGARDRDQVLALALAKLAGVELPESLLRPLTGNLPHIPVIAGTILCNDGHENAAGSKFCGECGAKLDMRDARALEAPPEPAEPPVNGNGNGNGLDYMDLHPKTLAKMCRDKGLDDTGGKADMAERLLAAV
jgi:hypothetical protein